MNGLANVVWLWVIGRGGGWVEGGGGWITTGAGGLLWYKIKIGHIYFNDISELWDHFQ